MTTAAEPIVWNPVDPAIRSDPYEMYARLLAEDPVHESPLGMLVLSRFADVEAVLRHPGASSDEQKSPMFGELTAGIDPADVQRMLEMRPFLFLDPPDHTRLRGLVSKAFTPRTIETLRSRAEDLVDGLLTGLSESATCDLVEEFAYPLPVTLISEMLGVPAEDAETFVAWSRVLARSLDPDFVLPVEARTARDHVLGEFHAYFRELIAQRRRDPRDDVLSALVHAEEEGNRLSENEVLATCTLLLVAGHETTVNLIANGALALLRHPDQAAELRADPGLARGAVEEVLRYDPPVQLTGRFLLTDVPISDRTLAGGRFVILLLAAANRDPAVFDSPDRFVISRPESRHLSFAFGHHFCLGAPLARLEGQIALRALFTRFPGLALADDDLEYRENLILRGLARLPVRTDA